MGREHVGKQRKETSVNPPVLKLPPEIERQLVARLVKRDASALAPLVEQYGEYLYRRTILPCIGAPEEAKDVLKEVFLTAFDRIETFSWRDGGLFPWLRRIAHNKSIDKHRARAREKRFQTGYAEFLDVREPTPNAEAQLVGKEEEKENSARMKKALLAVSSRYRQAIELRILEEKSREECARVMEITVGNFDVVLFRALTAFRKKFFAEKAHE